MTIFILRKVKLKIAKIAKAAYPKEFFAFLLGTRSKKSLVIEDLFVPIIINTENSVTFDTAEAFLDVYEYAGEENLEVLGDIHSHPDFIDASPSEQDWNNCQHFVDLYLKPPIMGIVGVFKDKNGKLKTRTKFYPGKIEELPEKVLNG